MLRGVKNSNLSEFVLPVLYRRNTGSIMDLEQRQDIIKYFPLIFSLFLPIDQVLSRFNKPLAASSRLLESSASIIHLHRQPSTVLDEIDVDPVFECVFNE